MFYVVGTLLMGGLHLICGAFGGDPDSAGNVTLSFFGALGIVACFLATCTDALNRFLRIPPKWQISIDNHHPDWALWEVDRSWHTWFSWRNWVRRIFALAVVVAILYWLRIWLNNDYGTY